MLSKDDLDILQKANTVNTSNILHASKNGDSKARDIELDHCSAVSYLISRSLATKRLSANAKAKLSFEIVSSRRDSK
jgi:hypothetical protein